MIEYTVQPTSNYKARSGVIASALLAIVFGVFIVLGVGFSHSETIHNSAHDSRHSFAFPCH